MLEKFPDCAESMKICFKCRNLFYNNEKIKEHNCMDDIGSDNLEDIQSERDSDVSPNKKKNLSREDELENLLNGLKEKFRSLPLNDPLRTTILTIAPDCWSARKISEEFGTSRRQAIKAKKLRNAEGVMAFPTSRSGKTLPSETIEKVIQFYESDENSRIMPSTSEVITIKKDGIKQKVQKRLILSDVRNLHELFKEKFPEYPIGLTKFAELRPKWCVLAGAKGTHSVCVCTIHENFKNMLDASNIKKFTENSKNQFQGYKDCFNFVLCRNPWPKCYLNECNSCPKYEAFSEFISETLESNGIEEVIFSTWQATDRCTLKKECLSTDDFASELCEKLKELLPHHFIANKQCKWVSDKIENLKKMKYWFNWTFQKIMHSSLKMQPKHSITITTNARFFQLLVITSLETK